MTDKKTFSSMIIPLPKISEADKSMMFDLMSKYYDNLTEESFYGDMNEKDWCIIIKDDSGNILGFSTIQVFDVLFEGKKIIMLFSGDTIVAREFWKYNFLVGPFGHFLLYLINNFGEHEKYWLLISKGYRTYRFLPLYFKEFYPCHDKETPRYINDLIDHVAADKFRELYDPDTKIIMNKSGNNYLREELNFISAEKRKNPHINYFMQKNRNYIRGDELVCLTKINKENLNKIACKITDSTDVTWM